jgi:transporter family-2 protein
VLARLLQGGVVFLVGAVAAMQAPINAALAKRTGALPASTISFLVGTVILLLVSLAVRPYVGGDFSAARDAPWWQWTGGLLGAVFVATSVIMVPRLGATGLIAALIAGQIAGSFIIDQLGLFGLPRIPVTAYRLLGLALLAAGGMLALKR